MAEVRFTRGPWKWWTSNSWRRLKLDDRGITQSVLEPFTSSDGHPNLTVTEADMALIAAAPDLYAALSKALVYVVHEWDEVGDTADKAVVDECRAALARARGEQP